MAVILYQHVGMFLLDGFRQFAQHTRTADARHVLQADFGRSRLNKFVGYTGVVLHRMYGRMSDTERCLRYHARFERIADGRDDVARFIQSAEDTGDIHALRMLHLVHQPAHIGGNGIHTQRIQSAVEHVGLYARIVERLGKGADCLVRVLTIEKVHLLESSAVGLDTCKAAHFDYQRCDTYQLVYSRLVFTGRLPHIAVNKTEFDFFFHCNR